MSLVTENQPDGTPTWIDLGIPDLDLAMEFYGSLFGWEFAVGPEEYGRYTTCLLDGRRVAAIMPHPNPAAASFWWNVYFATTDCDASAERVRAAGGTIVSEPADVMDQGRMAIARDPLGAPFGLWQGRKHIGCEVVNEPGPWFVTTWWAWLLVRMLAAPLGLVAVDVASDLRGAGAERPGVRRELSHLAGSGVERVPVPGEHPTELRVAHHCGVPDPVDRLDAVHHANRMQPSPRAGGVHARVDLQVEMAVRVASPARVVPHHGSLELLDRDLHLPATRPEPG